MGYIEEVFCICVAGLRWKTVLFAETLTLTLDMVVCMASLSGTRSKLKLLNKAIKGVTSVDHVKALLIRLYSSFRFLSLAHPSNVISKAKA